MNIRGRDGCVHSDARADWVTRRAALEAAICRLHARIEARAVSAARKGFWGAPWAGPGAIHTRRASRPVNSLANAGRGRLCLSAVTLRASAMFAGRPMAGLAKGSPPPPAALHRRGRLSCVRIREWLGPGAVKREGGEIEATTTLRAPRIAGCHTEAS